METRDVPVSGESQTAEIDLCTRCGGVFLEFFDGEPSMLAHGMLALAVDTAPAPRAGDVLRATCPDCGVEMRELRYMEQKLGPVVFRCDACMAVFANHDQIRRLASFLPWLFGEQEE
jgi:Zn-finger nucleic acid-binding protein